MRLLELQRWMGEMVTRPLTSENRLDRNRLAGGPVSAVDTIISPSAKLTAIERLEIYNRGFWFRILDSMREDFPAVKAFLSGSTFDDLVIRYIRNNPSTSWTLRNLGMNFEPWLRASAGSDESLRIAADIARLEWAYVEAYDAPERPGIDVRQLQQSGTALKLRLQPYVQLVHIEHAVQDLVLAAHSGADTSATSFPGRMEFLAVYRQDFNVQHVVLTPLGSLVLHAFRHWQSLEDVVSTEVARKSIGPSDVQQIASQFHEWSRLGFFTSQEVATEEWNG